MEDNVRISTLDLILVLMTSAFLFYCAALVYSKRNTKTHIILAVFGFVLDISATYMMEIYGRVFVTNFSLMLLYIHTTFAVLAIISFTITAYLGARRNKNHNLIARFIFLPIWIISYALGICLII